MYSPRSLRRARAPRLALAALAAAAAALALAAAPRPAAACTSLLVGRRATKDGSMITARTADAGGAVFPTSFALHPEAPDPVTFKSTENKFEFKLPAGALAYAASPGALSRKKLRPTMETVGVNSRGVSVSATETLFNSKAALAADPLNEESGVNEDSIVSVILPLAESARDGAARLGALIEERGAAEGFGVLFMDLEELWYLETASGHRWIAQKVPDDSYLIAANQGRLTFLGPDTLMSPDLEAFAEEHKLCSFRPSPRAAAAAAPAAAAGARRLLAAPPARRAIAGAAAQGAAASAAGSGGGAVARGDSFNFFKCYGEEDEVDRSFYNLPRIARVQALLSHNNGPDYPTYVRPSKLLTHWDVIAIMRDTFEGTDAEAYMSQNPNAKWRPVALLRTQLAHVSVRRPAMRGVPDNITYVEWLAWGMPVLSPFMPVYAQALSEAPRRLITPPFEMDDTSMYWICRKLQAVVFQNYPLLAPLATPIIRGLERTAEAAAKAMEFSYAKLHRVDPAGAAKLVQAFTDETLEVYAAALTQLTSKLAAVAGLGALTDDDYLDMLEKAEEAYHFHKEEDELVKRTRASVAGGDGGVVRVGVVDGTPLVAARAPRARRGGDAAAAAAAVPAAS